MSECVGKTNTRLEVKCSDCAPGKIPEPAANARLPFLLWKERENECSGVGELERNRVGIQISFHLLSMIKKEKKNGGREEETVTNISGMIPENTQYLLWLFRGLKTKIEREGVRH